MEPSKRAKTVNGVAPREAETREEKMILGFLHQEAERINFGQVVLEFQIRAGKIVHVRSKEISRTFNVGDPS